MIDRQPSSPMLGLRAERRDNIARLFVSGELDLATVPHLERALEMLQRTHRDVFVDLSELAFIDATGLRTLLVAAERAQVRGDLFAVTNFGPSARILFEVTGTVDLVADGAFSPLLDDGVRWTRLAPTAYEIAETQEVGL